MADHWLMCFTLHDLEFVGIVGPSEDPAVMGPRRFKPNVPVAESQVMATLAAKGPTVPWDDFFDTLNDSFPTTLWFDLWYGPLTKTCEEILDEIAAANPQPR